jgi:hypothetical protein
MDGTVTVRSRNVHGTVTERSRNSHGNVSEMKDLLKNLFTADLSQRCRYQTSRPLEIYFSRPI